MCEFVLYIYIFRTKQNRTLTMKAEGEGLKTRGTNRAQPK